MTSNRNDREQAWCGAFICNDERSGVGSRAPRVHQRRAHFTFLLLILLPLFLLSLFGCPLYNPAAFIDQHQTTPGGQQQTTTGGQQQAGPNDILSTASQVTLLWNQPASGGSQVVNYTVSYRVHGTSTWTLLATVPASSQPSFTVLRSVVGSGDFDFAVAAVDSGGTSSPMHTSLDPTADPTTGWFLSW
jgi:hypothetical protein